MKKKLSYCIFELILLIFGCIFFVFIKQWGLAFFAGFGSVLALVNFITTIKKEKYEKEIAFALERKQ